MSAELYKPTVLLRMNKGMMRDCWLEDDTQKPGQRVLVIRQIRFLDDAAQDVQTKVIRLEEAEWVILRGLLKP